MSGRVLGIELRRSVALWAGLVVLGSSLAILYALDGLWWRGTTAWNAQWTPMALTTRSLLAYLWPLSMGFGAVYGLRDSRSRMGELLASTPRPAWRRAALPAGALALAVASGFGLLVLWGAGQVAFADTDYLPVGWLPISLVAVLALAAAAVFGMGVARALPSVLVPPILVVGALLTVMYLRQTTDGALPSGQAPNRFSQLSPVTDMPRQLLLTLSGRVDLGQALWFLGLLGTGFALLAASTRRARLLSAAPVLAGAVLALLVLPADPRDTFVVDRSAAAPVCDGPVCLTRAHRSQLPAFAASGKEALRVLHQALGDQAPASVHEETALRAMSDERQLSADVVLIDLDDPLIARATGAELTRLMVGQGLAPNCRPRTIWEGGGQTTIPAQSVAASWALGDRGLVPLEQPAGDPYTQQEWTKARAAWETLNSLPAAEQRSRMARVRAAALSCGTELAPLTGEVSR
ncbi:hypothetical protein AB0O91_39395 [Kitasatospora sp. NPDC089797]|uniref:hypothetical protein n=1 Tax=Kitasatospora sp. NPDC089797 TaxID=3155298 RepID=UPI0034301870